MPAVGSAQQISGNFSPVTIVASTGAASVTGTASETNLQVLKVPANSMGPNGAIYLACLWTYTNSSNAKTLTVRFTSTSGAVSGGVLGSAISVTTTATTQSLHIIRNNNATNSQTAYAGSGTGPFGSAAAALTSLSVDTTQDAFIDVNGTLANTGETITAQHCVATIYKN